MASTTQRALFVGGTAGIGNAMAVRLAATTPSAQVIISGRTKPQSMPHPNMEFLQLDASSMRAIRTYADDIKAASAPKLDMLVMTQGIMTLAGRTETAEGIDNKMALHYYGKQLLIRELLPALKDEAKVVIVLDAKRGAPSELTWDDLDLKTNYSLAKAAAHCLSMTDAMMQHFAATQGDAKRHFIHAYPGFVNTSLGKKMPFLLRGPVNALMQMAATSPEQCAEYMLDGAANAAKEGETTGSRWGAVGNKGESLKASKAVWTEEQRSKVAEHTWKIIDDALAVT